MDEDVQGILERHSTMSMEGTPREVVFNHVGRDFEVTSCEVIKARTVKSLRP